MWIIILLCYDVINKTEQLDGGMIDGTNYLCSYHCRAADVKNIISMKINKRSDIANGTNDEQSTVGEIILFPISIETTTGFFLIIVILLCGISIIILVAIVVSLIVSYNSINDNYDMINSLRIERTIMKG